MRVEKWTAFATPALIWAMSYSGFLQNERFVSSSRTTVTREQHVPIIIHKLINNLLKHTFRRWYTFNTDKPLLTHAEKSVCGWWTVILYIMKKICQHPTCIHTLCSAPKAQYSTTTLIQNTIPYSLKHATFPGFKYRIFVLF